MFFKGIAIFFVIYRSIETELIKSKRATHFDFWVTPALCEDSNRPAPLVIPVCYWLLVGAICNRPPYVRILIFPPRLSFRAVIGCL